MNNIDSTQPSILVLRLSAIGDVANALPAVAGLRKLMPRATIGWIVEPEARDLVVASQLANHVYTYPRRRLGHLWARPWLWPKAVAETARFLRPVRDARYDWALDFQGNLKSGLISLFSRARERVGFARGHCREMNWLFNRILAMPASRRMLRAEKNAALAQVIHPECTPEIPTLRGTEQERKTVEEFLNRLGPFKTLILIHPGTSSFGSFKRWPAERFGQLAGRLARELDATCLLTHGPGEESLVETVRNASGDMAVIVPTLPIGALIELLRRANLFIAGDTGPLHIAAMLRRPIIALFGPKDPAIYRPWTDTALLLRKDLPCSPCTRRQCDHVSCIMEISVQDAFKAAKTALGNPLAQAGGVT